MTRGIAILLTALVALSQMQAQTAQSRARQLQEKISNSQTNDIDTGLNEFVVPKWLGECAYTIDNEASPKTVSVSWTVRHGLTIFVR